MTYKKMTTEKRLQIAQNAITNALNNTKIAQYLSTVGYGSEQISEGFEKINKVKNLLTRQDQEYRLQKQATTTKDELKTKIKDVYSKQTKLATVAFKHDVKTLTDLGLTGARERQYNKWKAQVERFYNIALQNEDIKLTLSRFKITEEDLVKVQLLLHELETSDAMQEDKKAMAQQATVSKDNALKDLDDWMEDFLVVSKVALSPEPQLMEAMGITTKR